MALCLTSCRSTQLPIETKIGYDPRTGLINLALPKNSSWSKLKFDQKVGTNTISLLINNGSFTNNPLVLDAAGAANVAAINAWGGVMNSMLSAAIALAGKGAPLAAAPLDVQTFQYQLSAPKSLTFTNTTPK